MKKDFTIALLIALLSLSISLGRLAFELSELYRFLLVHLSLLIDIFIIVVLVYNLLEERRNDI